MERISIEEIVQYTKSQDPVARRCVPLQYVPCFPVLSILNDCLCLRVLFLRQLRTQEVDKTYIFPIQYVVTMELPTRKIVGFADLEYDREFSEVDFEKPISTFRHEALRNVKKDEYRSMVRELYAEYDNVANYLLYDGDKPNDYRMAELLQKLVDPKLLPFYLAIDGEFYAKYLQ